MKKMTKNEILAYLNARGILRLLNEESLKQNRISLSDYLNVNSDENFVNIINNLIIWDRTSLGRFFWSNENDILHEWYKSNYTREQSCEPKFKIYQDVTIHVNKNFNYFTDKMCDYDNKKATIKQVFVNDHVPNNDDGCLYYIEEDDQQFVWTNQYFN